MTDDSIADARHRCAVSYRPLNGAEPELRRLDDALDAIARASDRKRDRAPGRWRLHSTDDRTVLIEGDTPYTTLYVTSSAPTRRPDEPILRPAVDLSRFWRVWRPPLALLGPDERRWLAARDLADDPAAPLPARFDRTHGWRDFPAERLSELVRIATDAADALSEGTSEPQKGAA